MASLVAASILLIAMPAHGQGANYENVVFGELATGMAGAAIALADEPSAAFFNPAGLARLDYDILGLSVQAYGGTWIYAKDLLQVGDAAASLKTSTFGTFPTSIAYSVPLGRNGNLRHALAFSVVAPVNHSYSYSQSLRAPGVATLTTATSLRESELLGGMSYALRTGALSLGATVFSEYASVALENLFVAQGSDASGQLRSLSRARQSAGTQLGVTGVLGAHLQLSESWSAGLRARLPNLRLRSSSLHTLLETDRVEAGGIPGAADQVAVGGVEGEMRYRHPLGLGLGLGFRTRRLLLAFDAKSYLPLESYAVFQAPVQLAMPPARTKDWDPTVQVPRSRLVVNFAMGGELYATERISFLFGLNTDSSSRPSGVAIDTGGASTMSFIGVTTGLRSHSAAGTFTFAFVARHGTGTIESFVWNDGLETGNTTGIEQSSGMLTISWTRPLTANLSAIKSQLDGIVGQ